MAQDTGTWNKRRSGLFAYTTFEVGINYNSTAFSGLPNDKDLKGLNSTTLSIGGTAVRGNLVLRGNYIRSLYESTSEKLKFSNNPTRAKINKDQSVTSSAGYLVHDDFYVYGTIGYSFMTTKITDMVENTVHAGLIYGVGADYSISDTLSLRGQYTLGNLSGSKRFGRITLGTIYKF